MPVSQTPTDFWVEQTPGVKTYYTPPPATPATPPKTITDPSGYTGTGVPKWAVGSQYDTAPNAANNFNQGIKPPEEPVKMAQPFAPMNPDDPYGVGSAYQGYIDSLKETDEVKKTRKQLDEIEASKQLGLVDTENRTIPMAFITGQQSAIEKRAGALQTPLNQRLAVAQQQAQTQQQAAQAAYQYATGNRQFAAEEAARKAALNQPYTLSEGQRRFDANGNLIASVPKTATPGSGGQYTTQQYTRFNQIVGKYQASPLMKASDRTPVLAAAADAVIADPNNAALQMNLTYAYIQALDTYQSAVREGELKNVNSIDSKIGALQNWVEQVQNGQQVRGDVALQVANAAKLIIGTIDTAAKSKADQFRAQAQANDVSGLWSEYESGFAAPYNPQETKPATPEEMDKNIKDTVAANWKKFPNREALIDAIVSASKYPVDFVTRVVMQAWGDNATPML